MRFILPWLARIRALLAKGAHDRDMAEQMQLHLELMTEENIANGMAPAEARNAALRKFGGIERLKEQCRDERSFPWVEELVADLRYAVRTLRKARGFTIVTIVTLALGIGAATAIFSVVNSVVLRPLPYPDSERLVALRETMRGRPSMASRAAYDLWARRAVSFEEIAAFRIGASRWRSDDGVIQVRTAKVTPSYFPTLGIRPAQGRDFLPEEGTPGKGNVVVLGHRFWLGKFGGRGDVIGQTIQIDEQMMTVVGILPANPQLDSNDVYSPLATSPADRDSFRIQDNVQVVARLKPDVTLRSAASEMDALGHAFAIQFPARGRDRGAALVPLLDDVLSYSAFLMTGVKSLLFPLLGAVGLLLLIACMNVANLLLARASSRRKEIAMRATLGASRARIVRQLLGESLLLAVLGGSFGVLLAGWGIDLLSPLTRWLPRAGGISLDTRALAFSCAVTVLTGIGFGLFPALHATGPDLLDAIKEESGASGSRRSRRIRSVLIAGEIALALVLLTGAGLLINSFIRLQRVDLGFRTEGIYVNHLDLSAKRYESAERQIALVDEVLERLAHLPDFSAAAFTTDMPLFGGSGRGFKIAGRPEDSSEPVAVGAHAAVTPQYFRTMGIRLLRGREFSPRDRAGAPRVAIISEAWAKRYFPDINPIGQRIAYSNDPETWREIVGIVSDVKQRGPASDAMEGFPGNVYEPFAQNPSVLQMLVVQTRTKASDLPAVLRSVVHSIDPDVPLSRMYRLSDEVAASTVRLRLSMTILACFSSLALLLAAVGVYGVIAYNVAQRTGEIGIRMALGARRADVIRLVFCDAGRLIGVGLLLGLGGAIATTRFLQSLLFGVGHYDPVTFAVVAGFLSVVALLACWIPARRAARVDPLVALRHT